MLLADGANLLLPHNEERSVMLKCDHLAATLSNISDSIYIGRWPTIHQCTTQDLKAVGNYLPQTEKIMAN